MIKKKRKRVSAFIVENNFPCFFFDKEKYFMLMKDITHKSDLLNFLKGQDSRIHPLLN
jgi:hypothetical protein